MFASDAISSTAYAAEEILLVLLPAARSVGRLNKLVPISIVVVILLAIVVTSYRQTLFAYPSGGGAYIVSRENLGEIPSLVAGASLLVDYILTVAVSVSAGVAAIVSAQNDTWVDYRVPICLACVLLMMLANLRGREGVGPHLRRTDVRLHPRPRRCCSAAGCTVVLRRHLQPHPRTQEAPPRAARTTAR